jgi:hypothetical protein
MNERRWWHNQRFRPAVVCALLALPSSARAAANELQVYGIANFGDPPQPEEIDVDVSAM